jgi:hypothetical protein
VSLVVAGGTCLVPEIEEVLGFASLKSESHFSTGIALPPL